VPLFFGPTLAVTSKIPDAMRAFAAERAGAAGEARNVPGVLCICVLILLNIHVRILLQLYFLMLLSYNYMCPHTTICRCEVGDCYMSSYSHICISSYHYICVLTHLYYYV
jgi:hypothetical protein